MWLCIIRQEQHILCHPVAQQRCGLGFLSVESSELSYCICFGICKSARCCSSKQQLRDALQQGLLTCTQYRPVHTALRAAASVVDKTWRRCLSALQAILPEGAAAAQGPVDSTPGDKLREPRIRSYCAGVMPSSLLFVCHLCTSATGHWQCPTRPTAGGCDAWWMLSLTARQRQ
jgi:hypothetical protein